ncbi:right-handed parallel beta-helix repeat-containing protein [Bacillus cereus group sp. BfR-BA-01380]|uniref:right-handed parallel beta-helix repeat-containing protein n=1 Tax=Bacillus cereus group sp. BfR-BA-01380 TaxID=2920324 RepID=UPI001F59F983|nr:right-handed parallel beta-helix repeat-containing protein [Bacillus cereus group sp. BfR-BA-01380]
MIHQIDNNSNKSLGNENIEMETNVKTEDSTFPYVDVRMYGAKADGTQGTLTTEAIQKALDIALNEGGVDIFIPSGIYRITKYLTVYKNTKIRLGENAILLRGHPGGIMKNGNSGDLFEGYNGNGNISIEGGTFDGNVLEFPQGFNMTGWARGENLTFRDITFKDVINAHMMDINACCNVVIERCKFLGYKDATTDKSRGYAESIQISNHTKLGFSDFGAWDGEPCDNITIRDCYFGSSDTKGMNPIATGIGNHSSVMFLFNRNIKVINNTFENATYAGVRALKFGDMTIQGNTFLNCERAITHSNPDGSPGEGQKDRKGNDTGMPESGYNFVVKENTFSGTRQEDIYIVGWKNDKKAAFFDSVKIIDNEFKERNSPEDFATIVLSYVDRCKIRGNTFKKSFRHIFFKQCRKLEIKYNSFEDSQNEFIYNTAVTSSDNTDFLEDVDISNNIMINSGRVGIFLQSITRFFIDKNNIRNTSLEADNQRSAILVGNASKEGYIRDNRVRMSTTENKNKYGIEVTPTCSNVQVFNNDVEGKTGCVLVASSAGFVGFFAYDTKGVKRKVTIDNNGTLVSSPV